MTTPIEVHIAGQGIVVGPDDRLVIAMAGAIDVQQMRAYDDIFEMAGLAGRVLLVSGVAELVKLTGGEG